MKRLPIARDGLHVAVRRILQMLPQAGELALHIQKQIRQSGVVATEQKSGSRFTAALTDADLLIESLLGTQLLLSFNDITFYGEEHERDLISAYFPKTGAYEITLDPVNGTLLYKDGLPIFDIILTIRCDGRFLAAIDYLPADGRIYLAIEKQAYGTSTKWVMENKPWVPLPAYQSPPRIVFTSSMKIETRLKLERAGFRVVDLSQEYDHSMNWPYATNSILTGVVGAVVKANCPFLDWGAAGFIASRAGGKWNNPAYGPAVDRAPMIVGATPALYDEIVSVIPPHELL